MRYIKDLILLLEQLEDKKIHYSLNKVREHAIMIEVAVPGERWEIEFNTYGEKLDCDIEIEKFKSDGTMQDSEELETLFKLFSDND